MELTAEGTFERNTKAVGSALRTLRRAEPEAVGSRHSQRLQQLQCVADAKKN